MCVFKYDCEDFHTSESECKFNASLINWDPNHIQGLDVKSNYFIHAQKGGLKMDLKKENDRNKETNQIFLINNRQKMYIFVM